MIFGQQGDHFSPLSGWLKNLQRRRATESVSCPVLYNKIKRHTFLKVPILSFILFLKNQTNKPSYFKITMGLLLNSLYEGLS